MKTIAEQYNEMAMNLTESSGKSIAAKIKKLDVPLVGIGMELDQIESEAAEDIAIRLDEIRSELNEIVIKVSKL